MLIVDGVLDPERLKSQFLFVNVLSPGIGGLTPVGCANVSLWDFIEASLNQSFFGEEIEFSCKLSLCGIQAGEVSGKIQFFWQATQRGKVDKRGYQKGTETHTERPEMQKLLSSNSLDEDGIEMKDGDGMQRMRSNESVEVHSTQTSGAQGEARTQSAPI